LSFSTQEVIARRLSWGSIRGVGIARLGNLVSGGTVGCG